MSLIPDWLISLLDDVGDWARDEALHRGLVDEEAEEELRLRAIAEKLNTCSEVELWIIADNLSPDVKKQIDSTGKLNVPN